MMEELEVQIVKLEPMRVASFYGFGAGPENEARDKLVAWAEPKGMLENPDEHRIFGFDNPIPSHGSPNYGYEFWITVDPDVEPEGDIRIVDFFGGLYAIADHGPHIIEYWECSIAFLGGLGSLFAGITLGLFSLKMLNEP